MAIVGALACLGAIAILALGGAIVLMAASIIETIDKGE